MNPQSQHLYLKPDEAKFLSMAIVAILEQIHESAQNPQINWLPEVRKDFNDMMTAGKALQIKLTKLGFDMRDLPPYLDGDKNEFLTKQS